MKEDWKFQYKAGELTEAAKARLKFYEGRLAFWQKKQKEVIAKIRKEGIQVDESVGGAGGLGKMAYSNTGRPASVSVRNDLVTDMNECQGKVAEHKVNVATYEGWVAVLADQHKEYVLELTQRDWLFFFSKKT